MFDNRGGHVALKRKLGMSFPCNFNLESEKPVLSEMALGLISLSCMNDGISGRVSASANPFVGLDGELQHLESLQYAKARKLNFPNLTRHP